MPSGKQDSEFRHPPDPQEKQEENGDMNRPSPSRERPIIAPSREDLILRELHQRQIHSLKGSLSKIFYEPRP